MNTKWTTDLQARSALAKILQKKQEAIESLIQRGSELLKNGEADKAIDEATEAIRLAPRPAVLYYWRSKMYERKSDFENKFKDCYESIRLDPNNSAVYNSIAWTFATCTDSKVRNGTKAIEYATKACEIGLWKNYNDMDTLAAAYAEAENFVDAVKWQSTAIEMIPKGNADQVKDYRERLSLYEAHKPFRKDPNNRQ